MHAGEKTTVGPLYVFHENETATPLLVDLSLLGNAKVRNHSLADFSSEHKIEEVPFAVIITPHKNAEVALAKVISLFPAVQGGITPLILVLPSKSKISLGGLSSEIWTILIPENQLAVRLASTLRIISGLNAGANSAEKPLRKDQEKFRAISENMTALAFIVQDGKIVFANPAAEQVTGFSMQEFAAFDSNPLDADQGNEGSQKKEKSETAAWEDSFRCKNGKEIRLSFQQTPIQYQSKKSILLTAFDISSIYEAREELARSEEKYRNLFEHSFDGDILLNQKGKILEINSAATVILGVEESKPIGKMLGQFFVSGEKEFIELLNEAKREGFVSINCDWMRQDKSIFPAEVSVMSFVSSGQNHFQVILRDETDIKKGEENEIRLESFFQHSTDGIFLVDLDGYIIKWNLGASQIFGYSAEEALHKHVLLLAAQGKEGELLNLFRQLATGQSSITVNFIGTRKDLAEVELQLNLSVVPNQNGLASCYSVISRDLTQIRVAEQALADSKENLALISNHVNEVIYRISIGPLGERKIVYVSPQVEKIVGFSVEHYMQFLDKIEPWFHPEDLPRLKEISVELRDHKRPVSFQYRFLHPKKKEYVWLEENIVPAEESDGRISSLFGTVRDVTNRMRSEEANTRVAAIVEFSRDAIFGLDKEGKITDCNKAAESTLGISLAKVKGTRFEDLFPLHRSRFERRLRSLLSRGASIRDFELSIKEKDESEVFLQLSGSALRGPGGIINGASLILRDITSQKRMLAEISKSLKEKEVLLREIHHRVKNNMQVISSLFLLQEAKVTDPIAKEVLRESQDRIRAMAMIHEKLYQEEFLSRIDMGDYISDLLSYLLISYAVSPGKVAFKFESDPIELDVNQGIPCALILQELISNAIKYAYPDGGIGEVFISLRKHKMKEGWVTIQVIDKGVGLPPNFNPEETQTLGMSLIIHLGRQLGGNPVIKGVDGFSFTLDFPLSAKKPA